MSERVGRPDREAPRDLQRELHALELAHRMALIQRMFEQSMRQQKYNPHRYGDMTKNVKKKGSE